MTIIRQGRIGSGDCERFYETYDAAEIWRRERDTILGQAFEYYQGCRHGQALPDEDNVTQGYFVELGWRAAKIDVRNPFPGDYKLIKWTEDRSFEVHPLAHLEHFQSSCLMNDLMECFRHGSATYVVSDIVDFEFRYVAREIFLPVMGENNKIAWVYTVQRHDDEPTKHNHLMAANSA